LIACISQVGIRVLLKDYPTSNSSR